MSIDADDIKPFSQLPLAKYFQHDLEKIKMAYRLSDSIRLDLKNIRASGDQVELAVKDFFKEKLFPKYHVCDGHIVDSSLKVSPQFDIIISENAKNPVLFNLADKSEIVYYETVYCFGEVKKSFYNKNLISDFSLNVKRSKLELSREKIPPNFIESGNAGFHIEGALTTLPLRNPLLSFMFFINSSAMTFSQVGELLNNTEKASLPNFVVLLDQGIILNVNKEKFERGEISINLYPEYTSEESLWVLMDLEGESNVLTYQYLLVLEHLNNVTLSTPDLRKYNKQIFSFPLSNFHKL